jgi:hypothetical protein
MNSPASVFLAIFMYFAQSHIYWFSSRIYLFSLRIICAAQEIPFPDSLPSPSVFYLVVQTHSALQIITTMRSMKWKSFWCGGISMSPGSITPLFLKTHGSLECAQASFSKFFFSTAPCGQK